MAVGYHRDSLTSLALVVQHTGGCVIITRIMHLVHEQPHLELYNEYRKPIINQRSWPMCSFMLHVSRVYQGLGIINEDFPNELTRHSIIFELCILDMVLYTDVRGIDMIFNRVLTYQVYTACLPKIQKLIWMKPNIKTTIHAFIWINSCCQIWPALREILYIKIRHWIIFVVKAFSISIRAFSCGFLSGCILIFVEPPWIISKSGTCQLSVCSCGSSIGRCLAICFLSCFG